MVSPDHAAEEIAQSRIGGIVSNNKPKPAKVRAMLKGDDNKFVRSQPTTPVVFGGGASDGFGT